MRKTKNIKVEGIGMTSQRTRNRLVERLQKKGITNPDVLEMMGSVPRHLFVDEALASRSYEDASFPIGHGQTISRPYIVAKMTELLLCGETLLNDDEKCEQLCTNNVLEVGTGSGYQAAVLGGLVDTLNTVEIIAPLYRKARDLLYEIGYRNIRTHLSDGSWGWPDNAPYDAIMVTAAPDTIPPELIQQLKIGGRLIIPVGMQKDEQILQLVIRTSKTTFSISEFDVVTFVPLISKKGTLSE